MGQFYRQQTDMFKMEDHLTLVNNASQMPSLDI